MKRETKSSGTGNVTGSSLSCSRMDSSIVYTKYIIHAYIVRERRYYGYWIILNDLIILNIKNTCNLYFKYCFLMHKYIYANIILCYSSLKWKMRQRLMRFTHPPSRTVTHDAISSVKLESFHQIWSNNSWRSCDNAPVPVFINNENTIIPTFSTVHEDANLLATQTHVHIRMNICSQPTAQTCN